MQKYSKINAADYVKDTLLALNDTHETLLSQNSGAAFPTANLVVGMTCFRTDQNKTYTLKSISPLSWALTDDLGRDIYDAETLGGKKPADYAHATTDGNKHVPATGTSNNGKVLTAGATAGEFQWKDPPAHATTDGNKHVPATGTSNKGKILKAGATAGSMAWEDLTAADITDLSSNVSGLPVGAIIHFPAATIPAGYLKCNGAAIGRTTYPELFAYIGTTYGVGDGKTTFNLPDLRGIFIKGLAEGRSINGEAIDAGRALGSYQGDAIRNITGDFVTMHGVTYDNRYSPPFSREKLAATSGYSSVSAAETGKVTFDPSLIVPTSDENRPRNVAMIYCIKAFDAPVNQSTVDMSKLAQDIAGLSAGLSTGLNDLALKKLWVSDEFAPTATGVPVIFNHNISGLDLTKAMIDVVAICKIAINGWAVGDLLINPMGGMTTECDWPLQPMLSNTTISIVTTRNNYLYHRHKTSGIQCSTAYSTGNWKLIFRIWY